MGQQQLLLVILVTIIVGIATVVAINVFGTSAKSANEDMVRQDMLVISSASQGYFIKPAMMGGGANTFTDMDFNDFNFPAEGINEAGDVAWNMNGTYIIDTSVGTSYTITGHPASCDGYTEGTGGCAAPLEATVSQNDINWGS
ncbi:MAG TPA: hypothetical protein VFM80_12010 [Gracilimonas sp.]|uniref:hypothetical protein n=1 Tax=Gracilimonas sp. TaxID=1974203 RepID=UPI002DA1D101|nr:hypothetical protein [Gracilimonas sp.]